MGNGHSLLRSSEEASDCQLRGHETGVAFAICSSLPLSSVNRGRVNSPSLVCCAAHVHRPRYLLVASVVLGKPQDGTKDAEHM